jgi:hypothetical protein
VAGRMICTAGWQFNKIFVIQSLTCGETGKTGTHLVFDTLDPLWKEHGIGIHSVEVANRAGFLETMHDIARECSPTNQTRTYPVLHLEVHGHPESGLVIEPSQETVCWTELVELCRDVNVACSNNLLCTLAVCHGFNAQEHVDIAKPAPFYALVGAREEIIVRDIESFRSFYVALLCKSEDWAPAMACLGKKFEEWFCEKHFVIDFAKDYRKYWKGRGRQQTTEELVTWARNEGFPLTLKQIRTHIKQEVKGEPERIFEEQKRRFLMSDHPENKDRFAFTFADLKDFFDEGSASEGQP